MGSPVLSSASSQDEFPSHLLPAHRHTSIVSKHVEYELKQLET